MSSHAPKLLYTGRSCSPERHLPQPPPYGNNNSPNKNNTGAAPTKTEVAADRRLPNSLQQLLR